MLNLNWPDFKNLINNTQASIFHVETSNSYKIFLNLNGLIVTCIIAKDEATEFETSYKSISNKNNANVINSPFAMKAAGTKKFFMRIHGVSAEVQSAPNNIDFVVPYNTCKITGVEIVGGELGDKVNLKVLDTPTGTISGIANHILNQFGYNVNLSKDYYKYESAYDADLIKDMKIRIEYDAKDELSPKTVYINFILHELKT